MNWPFQATPLANPKRGQNFGPTAGDAGLVPQRALAAVASLAARTAPTGHARRGAGKDQGQGAQGGVEAFYMDANYSAQASQLDAYRSWLAHFEKEPDAVEPGRTAHEMAALAASKASLKQQKSDH